MDEDLLQFQIDLKEYKLDKVIGHGSYADVYLAYNRERKPFAAKVALNPLKEEIDQISFQREIRILSQLKHAAFVGFVGYSLKDFNKKKRPVIITEYIPNGSLASVVDCFNSDEDEMGLRDRWNDTLALITVYGVASGMAYLHESHIIHRDMKPENILLDGNLYPRITDFGLSKIFEDDSNYQSMQAGTCQYMAPEIIQNTNYDISVDVYAYGVIIYELLTKSFAYSGMQLVQIINRVPYGYRPPIPSEMPPAYKNLIESCWAKNARQRPTFREIVNKIESDDSFITEDVNRDKFLDYVNFVKNFVKDDMTEQNNGKKKKGRLSLRKTSSLLSSEVKKQLSNENKALVKSADKDDNEACFKVGKSLIEGNNGFPTKINDGISYLTKSAKSNHVDSLMFLADLYSSPDGPVPQDMKQAKSLYFEAAQNGSSRGMVKLGIILQQQKPPDYAGAARLFKKASDLNDGEAMLNYGFLFKNGQGVEKDISVAVQYYKKSADQGFPRGLNAYGVALESGWVNNEPNEVEAVRYYTRSAEAGCPAGMRNLGFMYRDGKGVEQNDETAASYFKKAAKLNDDDAMMNYGYMLQTGRGVPENKAKAANYYKNAAKLGNDDAMYHYGLMLINGDGIPKDINKAMKYLKKAMDLGNPDAEKYYKFAERQLNSETNSSSKDKDQNNGEDSSKKHHHHHRK